MNVILFGKRVFIDVIKVKISRWDHPELVWAINPMASVLIRSKRGEDTETHRRPLEKEAEMGIVLPWAQEWLESPNPERKGKNIPWSMALPKHWFGAGSPQDCEQMNFSCINPRILWSFVTAALGNYRNHFRGKPLFRKHYQITAAVWIWVSSRPT